MKVIDAQSGQASDHFGIKLGAKLRLALSHLSEEAVGLEANRDRANIECECDGVSIKRFGRG